MEYLPRPVELGEPWSAAVITSFASDVQEWEWQLEELALYFLLWSEAANLRHLPECLWFLYWILRNSHMKMAEVPASPISLCLLSRGLRYMRSACCAHCMMRIPSQYLMLCFVFRERLACVTLIDL